MVKRRAALFVLPGAAAVVTAAAQAVNAYGRRCFEDGRTYQCDWIERLAEEHGRCLACGQATSARWDKVDRTWVPS